MIEAPRTDHEVARAVVTALERHSTLPQGRLWVAVSDGRVTLKGHVDWNFQREAATAVVRRLPGVHRVINRITVAPVLGE